MSKVGFADLPLHKGDAPIWLFNRMAALSHGIAGAIVEEHGVENLLIRISDPFWFQAFSCVIGFDWHSSGTTTVTCAALKQALKDGEFGISVAGGKGMASRKTPQEIKMIGESYGLSDYKIDRLVYSSKMSAKVDNSAIQDGHDLYHHTFFLTENGDWAVVQQGMSPMMGFARRYHWLHDSVKNFVIEPHASILGKRIENVLDMTATRSEECRDASVGLVQDNLAKFRKYLRTDVAEKQSTLDHWIGEKASTLAMPANLDWKLARRLYDFQPRNYEELLAFPGVGSKTVRALSLISELVYGVKASWRDPVKFTFAVGGKDGVPYPIDNRTMDKTIEIMEIGVSESKIGNREKLRALRRLRKIIPPRLR